MVVTGRCAMLGGLGKLAAEGLAHRTEKATEEAGKDLELRLGTGDPLAWACSKLIPTV